MTSKGPIITLAAGALVAVGLFAANIGVTGSGVGTSTPASAGGPPVATSPPAASGSAGSGDAASGSAAGEAASASGSAAEASPAPSSTSTGRATYAGRIGDGSLAVVVKGESAVAYFCDGRNESWLWGSVDGAQLSLSNSYGDTLTATRGGGRVTGSITVDGDTWEFALPSVSQPSGLYRATARVRGATIVGGWVVLPDGSQVGVATTGGAGSTSAPPIDPATGAVTVAGTAMTARPVDPARGAR